MFQYVFSRFGIPKGIVTNLGAVFTLLFWSKLCYHMQIRRRLSTAFHPQTNGQTRRQNQALEQYLRLYVNEEQCSWVKLLLMAEFAYNWAVYATTLELPFFWNYGWNLDIHFDVEDNATRRGVPAAREQAETLKLK